MTDQSAFETLDFATRAVRAGIERTQFGEHAEPIFLTSSFVFDNAAQAAARFAGDEQGFVYSRFSNPTLSVFQDRLASLEGAEACVGTASGMSAILSTVLALTRSGEHIVSSSGVFGATAQLFNMFARYGVETSYVALTDPAAWEAAIRPGTRMFYLETPSNPLTEVADLAAISAIARRNGVVLVVDNCFSTPALQRPLEQGADVVVHSATKFIDGQGRVLGGAVLASRKLVEDALMPVLRTAGPSLSPFNAWVLLKGLETLSIRMQRQCASALEVARWLEAHPAVSRVHYPGLESHPQHLLAMRQQSAGGAIVSFEVRAGSASAERDAAWAVVDGCEMLSITANLGDAKTTITHPSSTTHHRIGPEARAAAGIRESLLRVAIGLEAPADICTDLARGLGRAPSR
ncbi:MAG: O-succinylhomoserine sulfhydrylase [Burkholderiaceae bacterium]|nr:O-succinylhomoserine sulfhydrylase [Burkholderiaceae bacterium]